MDRRRAIVPPLSTVTADPDKSAIHQTLSAVQRNAISPARRGGLRSFLSKPGTTTVMLQARARRFVAVSAAFAATAWCGDSATAQSIGAPLRLTRLTGAITIDGTPDEPAWQEVPALPLTMYAPVFRGTPTQRTVIRVAYDDEYFYAAGWFYDTDPSRIRVNSLYRDRWNGDDAFAIYIDAFNDNRNAKWFGVTPAGIRFDQLVSDDGATLNASWDTFWSARTTITKDGWFAEVRIPFSSIGFRTDANGTASWD